MYLKRLEILGAHTGRFLGQNVAARVQGGVDDGRRMDCFQADQDHLRLKLAKQI